MFICILALYSSLLLLPSMCFFSVPYNPLGISFPLGQFQCFHQWDCMIQIEGVYGTMFYCGHHLVCVNEHNVHEHVISPKIIECSWKKRFYVKFSHEYINMLKAIECKKWNETYEKSYEIMSNGIFNFPTICKQWSHLGCRNF